MKYRIRSTGTPPHPVWVIGVPKEMAGKIPDDAMFLPELTEDGILYRRVEPKSEPQLPSWVKKETK